MPVRIERSPKPHITRTGPTVTLRLPGAKGDPGVADDASVAALVDNAASDTAASLNASYLSAFVAPAPSGGDDAAAVQAVIDSAAAVGGLVKFRAGNYSLASALALPSSVTIAGAGVGVTRLTVTADAPAFDAAALDAISDTVIRDLSITGRGVSGATSDCITLDTAADILIDNVEADLGSRAGIYAEDCTRVTVRNCRVTNNKGATYPAVDLVRGSGHLVTGCSTEGGAWVCVGLNATVETTVSDNYLRGGHSGVNVFGASHRNRVIGNDCSTVGSGVVVDGDASTAQHNVVDGNTCHGSNTRGIFVNNALDTSVTGNVCSGNQQNAGIYVVNSPRTQITGNTSVGNTGHGISLVSGSYDCVITGNLCRGNTSNGIDLATILRCTVTGNLCRGNGGHGISSSGGGAYSTITGNTCSENGAGLSGITVGSSRHVISGNTCLGTGAGGQGYGIRVTGGTNNLVVGNLCYQNATNNLLDSGTTTTVANNVTT